MTESSIVLSHSQQDSEDAHFQACKTSFFYFCSCKSFASCHHCPLCYLCHLRMTVKQNGNKNTIYEGTGSLFIHKNLAENIFSIWLECHASPDPVSVTGKMGGQASEKQLCVITTTDPKETLSELQDQPEPLWWSMLSAPSIVLSCLPLSLYTSSLHGWLLPWYTRHTPSGEVMCHFKLPDHYSLLDSKTRQSGQRWREAVGATLLRLSLLLYYPGIAHLSTTHPCWIKWDNQQSPEFKQLNWHFTCCD